MHRMLISIGYQKEMCGIKELATFGRMIVLAGLKIACLQVLYLGISSLLHKNHADGARNQ